MKIFLKNSSVFLSSALVPFLFFAQTSTQNLDKHQHGSSEMLVNFFPKEIAIDLESPSNDLIGFEHEARTEKEKQAIRKTITILRNWEKIFDFGKNADCKISHFGSSVHSGEEEGAQSYEGDKEEHEGEDINREEGHSDVDVEYRIVCKNFDQIKELNLTGFFKSFPNAQKISVEWISPKKQSYTKLTPQNPKVIFK